MKTKAYFKLDPAMSDRLCDEMKVADDVDLVDQYIYQAVDEARERGLGKNYMKSKLYHIDTHTVLESEDRAQVRLTGKKRKSINPVYAIVAQVFMIGETHEIEHTFSVVKENGKWKWKSIAGNPDRIDWSFRSINYAFAEAVKIGWLRYRNEES